MTKSIAILAPLLIPSVSAWGTLGHEAVAYIAENFVSSSTKTFAQNILGDTGTSYLASVATWADTYRYTAEGKFSAPYHFIDANDSPPSSCSVDYDRDCPSEGCVVRAISNYTTRVKSSSVSSAEKVKALKWIVHFIGDIHQPLHDEALDVGGNTIDVTWDGSSTNLHHIWDTEMPEKLVGGYALTDAQNWATNLTTEIKSGKYKSQASSWLSGMSLSDAVSSSMVWAKDANSYVCSTALPKGVSAVQNKELDTTYYDTAIPVIELQIAKAGYRLAGWLNLIATGSVGLTVSKRDEMVEAQWRRLTPVEITPADKQRIAQARRARAAFGYNCGPEGHHH